MANAIGPFSTATEMAKALRERAISSVELVQMHLERIDQLDGKLNAIPIRTPDRALAAARNADAALARGESRPLLGVPITLKESVQVAGLAQTAGIDIFRNHRPTTDGPPTVRTLGA